MKKKFFIILFLLYCSVWAETIGHNIISRSYQDSATYINFVDTSVSFNISGKIESWNIYGTRSGPLSLQVYRKVSGTVYMLVGENTVTTNSTGSQTFSIASANQIQFQAGDFIGWRFTATTSVPSQGGSIYFGTPGTGETGGVRWAHSTPGITNGQTLDFINADNRTYSIQANFNTNVPEPSTFLLFFAAAIFLYKKNR
ncbi:MAG: PEP-CTERM sorting domain-containing protein [Candidatus Brocadiae bacterium]|nr:PEP-CTERM sorting domain-containing protein [Candidatus Brocadiia bacterium]